MNPHEALVEKVASDIYARMSVNQTADQIAIAVLALVAAEMKTVTPEQLQAAWRTFRGDRKGSLLPGAGPAFKEAIGAAIAASVLTPGDQ